MKVVVFMFILLLAGCSSHQEDMGHPSGLEVTEIKPNKYTALTKQNLLHLAQVYDLGPFLFTKKVQIESQIVPHSHPVITLNTRNSQRPKKILAVFLHEELHWWTTKNHANTALAVAELKKIYPKAPVTTGAGKDSTHLHLIICYLEMKAVQFYLGEKEGREVITSIMKQDKIYPWVYFQVLNKDFAIAKVVKKYKLLPPPLT